MEVVMKLGMIIYSNDPETVFNAFRIGVFSLGKKWGSSSVFIGKVIACGTSLKIRHSQSSNFCSMSTLNDLHTIIKQSDKILDLLVEPLNRTAHWWDLL